MMTFSAPPSDIGPCAFKSALLSFASTVAPVKMAMSSNNSPCSSPKPGAFTAAALTTRLATFRTSVARASPSTSFAIMRSGLFCCMLTSKLGSRSWALLTVWSVIKIMGFSKIASFFSRSVMKYGEMYPLSTSMPSTTLRSVSADFASSTVMTPSWPTASTASAINDPMSESLFAAIVAT